LFGKQLLVELLGFELLGFELLGFELLGIELLIGFELLVGFEARLDKLIPDEFEDQVLNRTIV